ncbi:hypothetical protein R3I94_008812 [Phoxinus phoxinus]|uniref:Sterile alpha motif domain-containing 3-like n=1 Tax=Phoxinus phoxinus TaxID=58324 RepID=A0AAN9H7G7_9TELE
MSSYTWYPTSEQYNRVCSALVTKYQFLRDRTGKGYESWHEILKNKFKKERSPLVDIEEINKVRSRFGKAKNQMISQSTQQTCITKNTEDLSVVQDMHQKRQRSEESESGEDAHSIGIHVEKMRTECMKRTPNIRLLQDCMARTRNERTDYMKHHSTKETLSRYPALKIPAILVLEFESILDANIEKNILNNLALVAQKVIDECHRREVGVDICAELAEAKKTHIDLAHKGLSMAAAVLLLPLLFKESPRSLYLINEEPRTPNPVLYIKGRALVEESLLEILMEGEKVCEVDDLTMALTVLMAIHFIFNIEYAAKMKNTLKFVEKFLMCHNAETKIPPTVIKMANFLFD